MGNHGEKHRTLRRTEQVVTQTLFEGRPLAGEGNVHYCAVKELAKTEKLVSEAEKLALTLVQDVCLGKAFKVHVIDVSTLRGKLKACSKGVSSTPTIIVDRMRSVGLPTREEM